MERLPVFDGPIPQRVGVRGARAVAQPLEVYQVLYERMARSRLEVAGHAGEVARQVVGDPHQLLARHGLLGLDDLVLDEAGRGDHDAQHPVAGQRHEVDRLEDRGLVAELIAPRLWEDPRTKEALLVQATKLVGSDEASFRTFTGGFKGSLARKNPDIRIGPEDARWTGSSGEYTTYFTLGEERMEVRCLSRMAEA